LPANKKEFLRKDYPLRRRYNTSYSLLLAPDGFYGNDMGNGTFNGVVGLVQVIFTLHFFLLFSIIYTRIKKIYNLL
jgi:hypothetical protein